MLEERVARAVDAAIASAVVDRDAPKEETVAFGRDELAAVAKLFKADATRDLTWRTVRDRLSTAIDAGVAKYPPAEAPNLELGASVEWHDAMAAAWLSTRLERIAPATYVQSRDGDLQVRARLVLGETL